MQRNSKKGKRGKGSFKEIEMDLERWLELISARGWRRTAPQNRGGGRAYE